MIANFENLKKAVNCKKHASYATLKAAKQFIEKRSVWRLHYQRLQGMFEPADVIKIAAHRILKFISTAPKPSTYLHRIFISILKMSNKNLEVTCGKKECAEMFRLSVFLRLL